MKDPSTNIFHAIFLAFSNLSSFYFPASLHKKNIYPGDLIFIPPFCP